MELKENALSAVHANIAKWNVRFNLFSEAHSRYAFFDDKATCLFSPTDGWSEKISSLHYRANPDPGRSQSCSQSQSKSQIAFVRQHN
jgi:hypothetical protein